MCSNLNYYHYETAQRILVPYLLLYLQCTCSIVIIRLYWHPTGSMLNKCHLWDIKETKTEKCLIFVVYFFHFPIIDYKLNKRYTS